MFNENAYLRWRALNKQIADSSVSLQTCLAFLGPTSVALKANLFCLLNGWDWSNRVVNC